MSRPQREVVFVDGVRTPFGKAKGQYAETRADDLVIKCIRELMRRNPSLPPERVDEVAIAATTQIGDQGLTIGRTAALLAGPAAERPRLLHRPHVRGRDDGGDQHRLGHRVRCLRRRHRRRRRAHGPPPDGRGRRPQPAHPVRAHRQPRRARDGQDRGEPPRPLPHDHQAARRRVRRPQPAEDQGRLRRRQDPARPGAGRDPLGRGRLGPGHDRRADAPRDDHGVARGPQDPLPLARQRHRRQRRGHQRRRHRRAAGRRGDRARARPPREDAPGHLRLRGRRARGDGRRPDPGDREGAAAGRPDDRRHRGLRGQRGVRRAGARLPRALRHRRRRRAGEPLRRRDRDGPPAGLVRRTPDEPAGAPVRGAPRGPLRPHHHVHRHRHGRHRDLGEPALDRCSRD